MNISKNDYLIPNFNLIYEKAPFIVTYKEPSLDILYCNKLMHDYVGCKRPNDVIGKSDYDFRWAKFADLYQKHEIDTLNNNIYLAMHPVCDFYGNEALVTCHKIPFFDEQKNAIGVLTHAYLLNDKASLELSNILQRTEPAAKEKSYSINKKMNKIQLTSRERECLFYFIRGKSYKIIGKILGISYRTVETHIDNIKSKFGCVNKNELLDKAIEMGYLYDLPTSLLDKNFVASLKD